LINLGAPAAGLVRKTFRTPEALPSAKSIQPERDDKAPEKRSTFQVGKRNFDNTDPTACHMAKSETSIQHPGSSCQDPAPSKSLKIAE
jgi:hypothetical protein